jgi:hypothetical protein
VCTSKADHHLQALTGRAMAATGAAARTTAAWVTFPLVQYLKRGSVMPQGSHKLGGSPPPIGNKICSANRNSIHLASHQDFRRHSDSHFCEASPLLFRGPNGNTFSKKSMDFFHHPGIRHRLHQKTKKTTTDNCLRTIESDTLIKQPNKSLTRRICKRHILFTFSRSGIGASCSLEPVSLHCALPVDCKFPSLRLLSPQRA